MNINTLHYVLLAGLDRTPRSGYALTQWLARLGKHYWAAEHSSIYPALLQLEAAGLLVVAEEPGQRGRPRKIYSLSASGKRELETWVNEPSGDPQVRDEQMVKILSFDLLSQAQMITHLQRIRALHDEKFRYYETLLEDHKQGLATRDRKAYARRLGPELTLRRGILAAKSYVDWCDEALAIVKAQRSCTL